jgi:Holliday junction resolvase RusA-like endonuclease
MRVLVPQTWIKGTPRGYGNKKREAEWLGEIRQALKKYKDLASTADPVNVRYEVDFDFAVWPGDPRYGGQNPYHGTDLDNLIRLAVDGLTPLGGRGAGIITDDQAIYRVNATKSHAQDADKTGLWVTVKALAAKP